MNITNIAKDSRVATLLSEVKTHYAVSFKKESGNNWTSQVAGKKAIIGYVPTAHPAAALTHELLHLSIQHKGYRPLRVGFSTLDQTERFIRIMECLDNELQHHKMYPHFEKLGFPPEQFYADDDAQIANYLERVLAANLTDILDLLPVFFTVIAPGGCLTSEQKQTFRHRFLNVDNGRFSVQLSHIEAAVLDWAQNETLDAQPSLRAIFLALQNPCHTWFGYREHDRPPNDGFFVDQKFEVDETT